MNIITALKNEAKILADNEGINKEYNRALCELIAGVDCQIDADHEQQALRVSKEINAPY